MSSDIRITDVEALYLRLPEIRARTDSSQDALIVRVHTDAGIVGLGEVDSCPLVAKAVIEAPPSHTLATGLRTLLLGEDPFDVTRLWQKMFDGTLYYGREGAVIHAMAGVDIALWDVKAQALGVPIHELLGGSHRTSIRAYASHMFGATPDETAERARAACARGFTAVKFGWEPFGTDPVLDEALVRSIRDAVGSDVDVCIDAGLAWDLKTALQRTRMLEPYHLRFLEEPFRPYDLRAYRALSERVEIPIAAGEEEATVAGFRRLVDEGRIDIVQVDVTRTGLTQAMQIAALAAERGLSVCNHTFTTDLAATASLHFLAAIPNALMLEIGAEPGVLRNGLTRTGVEIVDGQALIPQTPGLGIELDPETVERFLVRD